MFNSSVSTSKSLAVEAVYFGFNSSALAKLVLQCKVMSNRQKQAHEKREFSFSVGEKIIVKVYYLINLQWTSVIN
jgi:F0F1-type ATP synthase assembly protein I